MLKRIPKSDISIRPFKAYKEWSFDDNSTQISLLEADDKSTDLSGLYPKNSIFGQLRAQFYNGQDDNPFIRTGNKTNYYAKSKLGNERYLSGSAKVISIPQIYVGEGIKKGSVKLTDNSAEYYDDSYGNLQDNRDEIILSSVNINDSIINFVDVVDNVYSASLMGSSVLGFDIQNNLLTMSYSGDEYVLYLNSIDLDSGILIADTIPFLPQAAKGIKIGNIFYSNGLVVLTRDTDVKLLNAWQLDYKSTQTIYEHEYLLIAGQDEFNVSTNPTAVVNVGRQRETHISSNGKITNVVTNPGVNYIKKLSTLENGNILDFRYSGSIGNKLAGFEHYEMSGSVDTTGSFLAPMITTIGLYDDDCQLVAVAKLPQPIKSEHDLTVNFIVRFDT
jgi:hypothetical protein